MLAPASWPFSSQVVPARLMPSGRSYAIDLNGQLLVSHLDVGTLLGYGFNIFASQPQIVPMRSLSTDYELLSIDSGVSFDNSGASGDITLTLPTWTLGLVFELTIISALYAKFQAPGSDLIFLGNSSANYVRSNLPASNLVLKAQNSGTWTSRSSVGSWLIGE